MEPRPELLCVFCALLFSLASAYTCLAQPATQPAPQKKQFRLWAISDAHVGSDIKSRESLAEAIRQSEGENGFEWDIAVNLGDNSGAQGLPSDDEGREVVKLVYTYDALGNRTSVASQPMVDRVSPVEKW